MNALMQSWVTRAAECRPDARAVIGTDRSFTYGEIEEFSNRLARTLRDVGCGRGDRVAVLMPRSALAVGAFVGALKADCAYVPVDPQGGDARRALMLRQCEPKVILASGCTPQVIDDLALRGALGTCRIGWLDDGEDAPEVAEFDASDVASAPTEAPPASASSADLAYVLFTSGTTGPPRGVPVTHGNVRAFIDWAVEYFELGPADRLSGHTALTFDLSTFDIYASLAAGAELHQTSGRSLLAPDEVPSFIEERELTMWLSVPSQLSCVARHDTLSGRKLETLRHVAWCGDVLPPPSLAYWRERLPHAAFTNLYGPMEATVVSSYHRVPDDHDPSAEIPIGVACPGEELLLLDDDLQPVVDGEVGAIYISGVGLSPGYWRDPARTREVFLEGPDGVDGARRIYRTGDLGRRGPDGAIAFLGRADYQIETSGYRVGPAEVENAVLDLAEVRACAVVPVKSNGFNGSTIGCAYVPSNGSPLRAGEAKKRLGDSLPSYLIPSLWLTLEDIPVDDRGKIDRRRLQRMMGG